MKKIIIFLVIGVMIFSSIGYGVMPKYISVQGRLSDVDGPVSGAYDFLFKR